MTTTTTEPNVASPLATLLRRDLAEQKEQVEFQKQRAERAESRFRTLRDLMSDALEELNELSNSKGGVLGDLKFVGLHSVSKTLNETDRKVIEALHGILSKGVL